MHGPLLTWTERITRLPVGVRAAAILTSIAVVMLADSATGAELSLNFSYSLCVMGAAWFISHRWGMIAAGLAAAAALLVNVLSEREEGWLILLANNALRAGSFLLFVLLTTAVRNSVLDLVDTTRLDEMTGILSRRGFLAELGAARRRAIQRHTPLGVVYLDLDGLKRVNDRDGHAAGDVLINTFADAVQRFTRSTDTFGRVGGDEFVLICPGTDRNATTLLITRLFADSTVPAASFGIATRDDDDDDATTLLGRADRAMYEFKSHRD